jgi:hypothetical protein
MPKPIRENEHKTYDLFDGYLKKNWSPSATSIANLFNAHHECAFTHDQIVKARIALNYFGDVEGIDLRKMLRKLIKARVLRLKMNGSVMMFEVNY